MLLRWDPFRDLDRLAEEVWTGPDRGPVRIPMDAVRTADEVTIHFELPGIDPDAIHVDIDRNVLSVSAERDVSTERGGGDEVLVRERRHGRFTRKVALGDDLDAERLAARYDDGVLTVTIPVSEQTETRRRVEITRGKVESAAPAIDASSTEAGDQRHTHAA